MFFLDENSWLARRRLAAGTTYRGVAAEVAHRRNARAANFSETVCRAASAAQGRQGGWTGLNVMRCY